MKRSASVWVALAGLVCALGVVPRDPIGPLVERRVDGIRLRIVQVNLDARVRFGIEVARGFPHGSEPFETLVARAHPTVAVDGAYFSRADDAPIGDIVVRGHLLYAGLMGTALAVTRDNRVVIRRVLPDHAADWSGFETVLACGPALVLQRRIDVDPVTERFRDPHVMGAARRMGIALLPGRRLAIVATDDPLTFAGWARVMFDYGAVDAMNLDAGASLAFYLRGRTVIAPGRALTNVLTITEAR